MALHVAGMRRHRHHAVGQAHVLRVDEEGPHVGRGVVSVRREHGRGTVGRAGVGRVGRGLEVVGAACAVRTGVVERGVAHRCLIWHSLQAGRGDYSDIIRVRTGLRLVIGGPMLGRLADDGVELG